MSFILGVAFFILFLESKVSGRGVDGGWSPWQPDADIDCCMFCNNPIPEGDGEQCMGLDNKRVHSEFRWEICDCACAPPCDGQTSFCANDTGKPAFCVCNYGLDPDPAMTHTDIYKCINTSKEQAATTQAPDLPATIDPDHEDPAKIVKMVTVIWLIAFLAAVLVIFFIICYFKPGRIIHMQEEITLIIVYILIGFMVQENSDRGVCKMISIALHYFFTCTIVFFCLEALHTYSMVTYMVPKGGYLHTLANLAIGYGLPLIPLSFSFGFLWHEYGNDGIHCWCNLDTAQSWGFLFPMCFLAFICIVIAEAQGQGKYKELPDVDQTEFTSARVSQGSIMIIVPLTLASYVFGLVAVDLQNIVLFSIFGLLNLILGPVIFFFHCIGNPTVRRLMAKMCPCLPCFKEKSAASSDDSPDNDRPANDRPSSSQVSPAPMTPRDDGAKPPVSPSPSNQPDKPSSSQPGNPGAGGAGEKDTDWKDFYKWVTDGKKENISEAENVLFEKK